MPFPLTIYFVFYKRYAMQTIKAKKPNNNSTVSKFRNLKAGSDECVVLETAAEYRSFGGNVAALKRNEKMEFTTSNGDNGTVLVWRVK